MSTLISFRIDSDILREIDSCRGMIDRSKVLNKILDYVCSQEGAIESIVK